MLWPDIDDEMKSRRLQCCENAEKQWFTSRQYGSRRAKLCFPRCVVHVSY